MKKLHSLCHCCTKLSLKVKETMQGKYLVLGEDKETIIAFGQTEEEMKENLIVILKRLSKIRGGEIDEKQKMYEVFIPTLGVTVIGGIIFKKSF